MNINKKVLERAESYGLESISTGGGLDYIIKEVDGMRVYLVATDDAGSPDRLSAPAVLAFYKIDEDGDEVRQVEEFIKKFRTTTEAIKFLVRLESIKPKLLSADEMLTEYPNLTEAQKEFLNAFVIKWDKAQGIGGATGHSIISTLTEMYQQWGRENGFTLTKATNE